jgi:multisubunit Na+/H+ antiporter MnhG subunit
MRQLAAFIVSAIGIISIMAGVALFIVAYCGNEGLNVLVAFLVMVIAACVGLYAIAQGVRWSKAKG